MSEQITTEPSRAAKHYAPTVLHEVIVNNRLHLDLFVQQFCGRPAEFSPYHHGSFPRRIIALPMKKESRQEKSACQSN
jgi:hypothetical protein